MMVRLGAVMLILFLGVELMAQPRVIPPKRQGADSARNRFAPGRFIITVADDADIDDIVRTHGIRPERTYRRVIKGFAGSMSETARSGLLRDRRIVKIERDAVITASQQVTWGLDRIDQRSLPLDGAYQPPYAGRGVTVYIVDSGIRFDHQEFGGRATRGYDAFGGDGSDCNGHGTHVAGTVGGAAYGVARSTSLVSVKVLDCNGDGLSSGLIAGLDWVMANARRPAVVNISLGGPAVSAVDDAVQRLINSGITVVVAAGNEGDNACNYSPARTPAAITVGASDQSDQRPAFSNYGTCVDLFAPGASIISAYHTATNVLAIASGTSMASPHVAGAAALVLEHYPTISPLAVRDTLVSRTTKGIVGGSLSTNNHLLYALERASGSVTPTPPPNSAPVANFTGSCTGLGCQFTDQSTDADGTITSWLWNFGNGVTSTVRNPSYSYPAGGTYTITLRVTDNAGATATTSRTVTITAPVANTPPVASFTQSCSGLGCQFIDQSTDADGSIVSRLWNFGNGITSTAQSPMYTYPTAGTYTVTLRVTDNIGASTTTSRTVTVSAPVQNSLPVASFTQSCTGLGCQFTDQSSDADGIITSWLWNFGNGVTSTTRNPSYSYPAAGTYTVSLRVTDNTGAASTTSRTVTVTAPAPPPATITVSVTPYLQKNRHAVDVRWSGATSSTVDIYRNGVLIARTTNSGFYADKPSLSGPATYTYRVCNVGTTTCSAQVTARF